MLAFCNQISVPTFRNNLLLIFYVLTLGSLQRYVKTMKTMKTIAKRMHLSIIYCLSKLFYLPLVYKKILRNTQTQELPSVK